MKKNILMISHFILLFLPLFGYDLNVSYVSGIELCKQPLYIIIVIITVFLLYHSQYEYVSCVFLVCMIVYEIYYALTWYTVGIMEFDIKFAMSMLRTSFYVLMIVDFGLLYLEIYQNLNKIKTFICK